MSFNRNLSTNLEDNLNKLSESFKDCFDIIQKKVILKGTKRGCFIYIKNFINADLLQRDFIKPLLSIDYSVLSDKNIVEYIPSLNSSLCYNLDTVITLVLSGEIVFLIDGCNFAVVGDEVDLEKRTIDEPAEEKNVRGSHDGFIESLTTNITLLRRKVKNNDLKFKPLITGNITNQNVVIAYIEGIANHELLNTLYNKVKDINVDGMVSIGYIEQYISDFHYSPFPQFITTQRTDKAVASLLEGRFLILLDGTPFVLIAPVSIFAFFQAPDDYSSNWLVATLMRLVRILGIITALTLPALYVSITSFQYYLVPLNMLVQLAQSRVRVAFPPIVEAFLMELTIQMLREASIRLPTYIGTTIGVVGGIIIGQAAVNAGIVSNVFVIIIGITAIASYIVPNYEFGLSIIVLRFALLIISSIFGIVGFAVGISMIVIHLLSLESLGQPYLMPIFPLKFSDFKDSILRLPVQFMKKRPHIAKPVNAERGRKNE